LLDRAPRPTAILAMSDELARGVWQAASERGIDVPRELSIVGFDDTPEAVRSRLTTVHQPLREKGASAARLLLDRDSVHAQRIELPTRLIVRASTAPAAA
jgi:DNA-binding LacI/PurR family transcriptional regulator